MDDKKKHELTEKLKVIECEVYDLRIELKGTQKKLEWPNKKCKISSPGCVYHACMDDGCQAQHMLKSGYHGSGDCKSIKPIS